MVSNWPPQTAAHYNQPFSTITSTYGYAQTSNLTSIYSSNYGYTGDPPKSPYDISKKLIEAARKSRERRRVVVHMPPPVVLSLCTSPLPEKRVRPQESGVAWLVQMHGGQRERRATRRSVEKKDAA